MKTKCNIDLESNLDSASETESEAEAEPDSNISTQITNKSIKSIYYEYLQGSELLLRPEYQRELCWSFDKMNAFIDTILKGWIIPNYVIYELSPNEQKYNNHTHECIDGQHRLTTLKWFIESKNLDEMSNKNTTTNKYIYWLNNAERVFYNMDSSKMNEIMKKRSIKCRNLTINEKKKFDNFQMSFHMIKSSNNNSLSLGTKCDIFNRLQNGEKVSSYEKLKNLHQNLITNCIRSNGLCKHLNDINFISKIDFGKRTRPKKAEGFNIYFLIRSFFIIDKKSLDINYLDLNIKKALEANNGMGEPKYRLRNDINELLIKVIEITDWIASNNEIYSNNSIRILPELAYIFICIYVNHGLDDLDKVIKWLYNPNNSKQFNKLNVITSYKQSIEKVTSSLKITEWYKTIIKLILKKDSDSENKDISESESNSDSKPKLDKLNIPDSVGILQNFVLPGISKAKCSRK